MTQVAANLKPVNTSGLQDCDPREARKAVLNSPELRRNIKEISAQTGKSENSLQRAADRYIRELVPGNSKLGYRLLIWFGRFVYQRGYDPEIAIEPEEADRLRELTQKHPVAFVSNHRSQMDSFAIFSALHDASLPHPFTFGGINMKLPIMGNILKGAGLIFIRRSFAKNLVYKVVLMTYIDFLVERRLPLFWAIEGTRSRTGKLVPPKFGLLSWVLDAQHRLSKEDLYLVPIVVSYEQITDVQSYSDEQRGKKKKPENFRWLVKFIASFKHPMGKISVRFGEAVSVHEQMDRIRREAPEILDQPDSVVRRIVITSCRRMNDATPVTIPSLVCLTLLGASPRAVTQQELVKEFNHLVTYVRANGWPATFDLEGGLTDALRSSLDSLQVNGVIECFDKGAEPVYSIAPGKDLSASYYRNNAIHFFVHGALAELAMNKARPSEDPQQRETIFWNEILHLREMFRFEFYFPESERFIEQVRADLDIRCANWQEILVANVVPLLCHGVLEPFVDAYQIVASNLVRLPAGVEPDKNDFINKCMGEAEQLYRLKRISHQETVARAMFEIGLMVAKSRGLTGTEDEVSVLEDKRREFEQEVNQLSTRLQNIRHIAATHRSV